MVNIGQNCKFCNITIILPNIGLGTGLSPWSSVVTFWLQRQKNCCERSERLVTKTSLPCSGPRDGKKSNHHGKCQSESVHHWYHWESALHWQSSMRLSLCFIFIVSFIQGKCILKQHSRNLIWHDFILIEDYSAKRSCRKS